MRILHLYKAYPPVWGGIEGNVELLARGQAKRGHEVTVLTTVDGDDSESLEDGVRVLRCRRLLELRSTPFSWSWIRRLLGERPDVAHLHMPYPFGSLTQLLAGRSRTTVVTYHCDIVKQRYLGALYRPLQRSVLRRVDRILVTNPRLSASSPVLTGLGGPDRRTVVPLGIELAANPDLDAASALPEAELPKDLPTEPFVLFVGRFRHYKGLPYLLRAMAELPARHAVLVGDGPLRPELEQLVDHLGLRGRVLFVGSVDEATKQALYRRAALLVLPSVDRSEAFGLVLVEAMAAGLPVVSTEVGTGTSWVNVDGVTGFVVPPRDPQRLAGTVETLLGDDELRRELGRNARQRAESELDAELMIERTLKVYAEVLEAAGPGGEGPAAPSRSSSTAPSPSSSSLS